MNKTEDKKFLLTIGLSAVLALAGGLTSYFNALASINEKFQGGLSSYRHEAESKFATKEEVEFLIKKLDELGGKVDLANDRLYEIYKTQVLVKVANDRLVKIQNHLDVAATRLAKTNNAVSEIKEKVNTALEKKKK